MKKIIIILIVVIVLVAIGFGIFFITRQNTTTETNSTTIQTGTLPAPVANSSTPSGLPDYIGQASQIYASAPTGTYLELGTSQGIVQVNNFYLANPPVVDGGDIVIKQTPNYVIVYDPLESTFWLGITGSPFVTWQSTAQQDFLTTLGVSEADACKLDVTSGVIYSPGNPDDGEDFPLTFCGGGAFQTP
jgi:hypothetical protein